MAKKLGGADAMHFYREGWQELLAVVDRIHAEGVAFRDGLVGAIEGSIRGAAVTL